MLYFTRFCDDPVQARDDVDVAPGARAVEGAHGDEVRLRRDALIRAVQRLRAARGDRRHVRAVAVRIAGDADREPPFVTSTEATMRLP